MKTNQVLQKDVQDAIRWEPLLNAAEIGVTAKDGVITLTGTVDSYTKKLEVEYAAKNVAGVKVVVEKIEVKFGTTSKKDDNEIASEILSAFRWGWDIPSDKIKVKVENGWVTLDGEVHWNYQKEATKKAVNHLAGVVGVSNNITIKAKTNDVIEKKQIEDAIKRSGTVNANDITVKVDGTKITLTGEVNSWYQRGEAERIVWNTPGVWTVDNELLVEYDYSLVGY